MSSVISAVACELWEDGHDLCNNGDYELAKLIYAIVVFSSNLAQIPQDQWSSVLSSIVDDWEMKYQDTEGKTDQDIAPRTQGQFAVQILTWALTGMKRILGSLNHVDLFSVVSGASHTGLGVWLRTTTKAGDLDEFEKFVIANTHTCFQPSISLAVLYMCFLAIGLACLEEILGWDVWGFEESAEVIPSNSRFLIFTILALVCWTFAMKIHVSGGLMDEVISFFDAYIPMDNEESEDFEHVTRNKWLEFFLSVTTFICTFCGKPVIFACIVHMLKKFFASRLLHVKGWLDPEMMGLFLFPMATLVLAMSQFSFMRMRTQSTGAFVFFGIVLVVEVLFWLLVIVPEIVTFTLIGCSLILFLRFYNFHCTQNMLNTFIQCVCDTFFWRHLCLVAKLTSPLASRVYLSDGACVDNVCKDLASGLERSTGESDCLFAIIKADNGLNLQRTQQQKAHTKQQQECKPLTNEQ
eukprot:TRINITY_DN13786_c0_g2_i1.p1 TRINITY_DN13786_c0_g2~~TRINITY_DN13786_c0_g2_i1.p1  ORF type:complete len:488 (+),score=99.50 TRINITY_DN13786_c0_g2_i1:69-1466(+)